jgi:pyroglutamyl-peptidase
MRRVLVTGFEPFGNESRNPSAELAEALGGAAHTESFVLPVVHGDAGEKVREILFERQPDIFLSLGLASGAAVLRVERLAVNLYRGGPDNAGRTVEEESLVPDAPAAYFATVPVASVLDALRQVSVPAQESLSPGTYCCNEVFFVALHTTITHRLPIRVGFVHVPLLPEMVGSRVLPSLSFDVQLRGLRRVVAWFRDGSAAAGSSLA